MENKDNSPEQVWRRISDIAKAAGVNKKTLWSWIKSGKLISHRVGSMHRIYDDDWQNFMEDCNYKK
jgi:excisionase family DNA binding protein